VPSRSCLVYACCWPGVGPAEARRRRRTRRGVDARPAASPEDVIGYLRAIALTCAQAAGTVRAGATGAAMASQGKQVCLFREFWDRTWSLAVWFLFVKSDRTFGHGGWSWDRVRASGLGGLAS